MKMLKRLFLVTITGLVLASTLVGCNTVHGAGVDISKGGNAIARAAK